MERFIQVIVDGVATGSIYAALAIALVLIFRSTGIVNFAQGEMAMFSTFIAWGLYAGGVPLGLAVLTTLALSFIAGMVIERGLIRHFEGGETLTLVIVTLGLFILLNSLAGWIWGFGNRSFPSLFGDAVTGPPRADAEAVLAMALEVAERGEAVRSQVRGAIVEELTARLLERRVDSGAIRRERRILFDGVRAEIHPYDVTVERDDRAEAYDCKWGARGISDDVLHQLDDARQHAGDEEVALRVALVVYDARRSCDVRLARSTAPSAGIDIVSLESLDDLARTR